MLTVDRDQTNDLHRAKPSITRFRDISLILQRSVHKTLYAKAAWRDEAYRVCGKINSANSYNKVSINTTMSNTLSCFSQIIAMF